MNDAQQLLVEALRSGEYEQGHKRLTAIEGEREEDCCLGVACKLYLKQVDPEFPAFVGTSDEGGDARFYDDQEHYLPEGVQEWLSFHDYRGLLSFVPRDNKGATPFGLADLNDGGFTFEQIADVIEAGLVR